MRMPCPLYHCFPLVRCSPPCRPNFPPRSALTHERTAQAAEAVQHCECDLVCTETKREILPFSPPQSHPDKRRPHPTKNVASFLWSTASPLFLSLPLPPARNLQIPRPPQCLILYARASPKEGFSVAGLAADDAATASDSEITVRSRASLRPRIHSLGI